MATGAIAPEMLITLPFINMVSFLRGQLTNLDTQLTTSIRQSIPFTPKNQRTKNRPPAGSGDAMSGLTDFQHLPYGLNSA
jgi:hypothetical protein